MKVLHLPTAVGGNAWGLAQAEKSLGLQSEVFLLSPPTINGYPYDHCMDVSDKKTKGGRLFHKVKTFLSIRKKYDIFHFNYGSSFFNMPHLGKLFINCELPFYPKKAKLFVTYNGCDARQKYPTMQRCAIAACHDKGCYRGVCNSGELDEQRRAGIRKMSKHVTHMWALNPDLLHFLPKEKASFLPYTICFPSQQAFPILRSKKLKIVHAPTNPEVKGSSHILRAIKNLKAKYGECFEFVTVDKIIPHAALMALYQQADLVIDQVLIGWYGAAAVEAMMMGKPVIARINPDDLHFIPPGMARDVQEALIHADPFSIEQVLERCIQDKEFLLNKAAAGLEYVHKWHDPKYVAGLTKEFYFDAEN